VDITGIVNRTKTKIDVLLVSETIVSPSKSNTVAAVQEEIISSGDEMCRPSAVIDVEELYREVNDMSVNWS